MRTQLKVIKTDGTTEDFLHTKVLGAISSCLSAVDDGNIITAEQLAEVVTYHIYNKLRRHRISSSEIFSLILAVLSSAGFDEAAQALKDHHLQRQLKRSRIEVLSASMNKPADAHHFFDSRRQTETSRWDKSRIVATLVNKHKIDRQTARAIASEVEQKVFALAVSKVPAGLVNQLVLTETARMLHSQHQLQTT